MNHILGRLLEEIYLTFQLQFLSKLHIVEAYIPLNALLSAESGSIPENYLKNNNNNKHLSACQKEYFKLIILTH